MKIVLAAHAIGRLADFLHGRQQQADQHSDDGDHHQQLNERKAQFAKTMNHDFPPQEGIRGEMREGPLPVSPPTSMPNPCFEQKTALDDKPTLNGPPLAYYSFITGPQMHIA